VPLSCEACGPLTYLQVLHPVLPLGRHALWRGFPVAMSIFCKKQESIRVLGQSLVGGVGECGRRRDSLGQLREPMGRNPVEYRVSVSR
jgi:hypothetical protein